MPDKLRLTRAQFEQLLDHALACKPEEACAILAGDNQGAVSRVIPVENVEHSDITYLMDSEEQFRVFDEIKREGLKMVAIFHSHPHSPAVPSRHDLDLAFYPDSIYLIVSLMNNVPEGHAYKIVDRTVEEIQIVIEED